MNSLDARAHCSSVRSGSPRAALADRLVSTLRTHLI